MSALQGVPSGVKPAAYAFNSNCTKYRTLNEGNHLHEETRWSELCKVTHLEAMKVLIEIRNNNEAAEIYIENDASYCEPNIASRQVVGNWKVHKETFNDLIMFVFGLMIDTFSSNMTQRIRKLCNASKTPVFGIIQAAAAILFGQAMVILGISIAIFSIPFCSTKGARIAFEKSIIMIVNGVLYPFVGIYNVVIYGIFCLALFQGKNSSLLNRNS